MKISDQVLFAGEAYRALYDYHSARASDLNNVHTETLICSRIADAAVTRLSVPYADALAVVKTVYAANRPQNPAEFFRFNNLWRIVTVMIEHPSMQAADGVAASSSPKVAKEENVTPLRRTGPPAMAAFPPPPIPPLAGK